MRTILKLFLGSNWKIKSILLSFAILNCTNLYARFKIENFKGLDGLIKNEFSDLHISQGLMALETGQLERLRIDGYFGPEKKGIPCNKEFVKKENRYRYIANDNDCPLNFRAALLQRLFPSRDLANFTLPGAYDKLLFDRINIKSIAKIVESLKEYKLGSSNQEQKLWKEKLSFELIKLMYPEDVEKSLRVLNKRQIIALEKNKGIQDLVNWEKCHFKDHYDQESFVNDLNSFFTKEIDPSVVKWMDTEKSLMKMNSWKSINNFVEMIFNAYNEELAEQDNAGIYPSNTVIKMVLGFMLSKFEKKEDILKDYILSLSDELLSEQGLRVRFNEELVDHIINDNFVPEADYTNLAKSFKNKSLYQQVNSMVEENNREAYLELMGQPKENVLYFAFAVKNYFSSMPKKLDMGYAKHESLKDSTYPDCGETAIRNFMHAMIYPQRKVGNKKLSGLEVFLDNAQKYELSLPSKIREYNGRKIQTGILSYFEHFPKVEGTNSQDARDFWSDNVVAYHDDEGEFDRLYPVQFLTMRESCEINQGLKNFIAAMNRFLGDEVLRNELKDGDNLPALLNRLGTIFSDQDNLLSWRVKGNKEIEDVGSTIVFFLNRVPKLEITFDDGHFSYDVFEGETTPLQLMASSNLINKNDPLYEFAPNINDIDFAENHLQWNIALSRDQKLGILKKQKIPVELAYRWLTLLEGSDIHTNLEIVGSLSEFYQDNELMNSKYHEIIEKLAESSDDSLILAAKQGLFEIAHEIFKQIPEGANVNPLDSGIRKRSLLHYVLAAEKTTFFREIYNRLPSDADPNPLAKNDETLLHYAAKAGLTDIYMEVHARLPENADPNPEGKNGDTPLGIAAQNGHEELTFKILELMPHELEPNPKTSRKKRLIDSIVESGNLDFYREALKRRNIDAAEIYQKEKGSKAPFYRAIELKNKELAFELYKNLPVNEDPNPKNSYGTTLLHLAASRGSLNMVNEILKRIPIDVDVNILNGANLTPLMFAEQEGHEEIVQVLLERNKRHKNN